MTELFIDGVQAVLPKDFSIQVKRENPLITKNGEYTYEITLQLTNATNAELYAHLNRLNSVQEVKTKRAAILVADNRVYCNGTEIITGWTDDTVSLQIASGNSELNYFVGGDLLIGTLEMKRTDVLTTDMFPHIEKTYPEVEYCLAPVLDQDTGNIHNQWCVKAEAGADNRNLGTDDMFDVTPQPYLCAYIKELMRALGYGLTENQLENTVYKDVYICHTVPTVLWNKMLPGWSVKDFLEQVERLFNAVFLVDNRKRTARLLLRGNYFTGGTSVHVQNVEDVYEVEVEEPDIEDPAFSNVAYKVEDSEFWRWNVLPEAVKKGAKRENIPEDIPTDMRSITGWFNDESHKKPDTIYTHKADGKEYVYLRDWVDEDGRRSSPVFVMVDRFVGIEREGVSNVVELEMVPTAFQSVGINYYGGGGRGEDTTLWIYLPSLSGNGNADKTEPALSIEEQIQNGGGEETESKRGICLALYTGLQSLNVVYNGVSMKYPVPYIDEYTKNHMVRGESWWQYVRTNSIGASLCLNVLDGLLYQTNYDIDYTKAVKVQSHDPNVYAAYQVFEIRNKRYVCKEMEFTLDAFGRKGAWTGTFYPIRISDTEADVRWILADGRWRDGGVWLDNGRWLDG